jgi:hypothetical protein
MVLCLSGFHKQIKKIEKASDPDMGTGWCQPPSIGFLSDSLFLLAQAY